MTDEELQHLRQLRAGVVRRRNKLVEQRGKMGGRTPAEILVEIEDANEEIKRLDAKILMPRVSAQIQEATGPEAAIDVLRHEVRNLGDRVADALAWVQEQIREGKDEQMTVLTEIKEESRLWRMHETNGRLFGQWRNFLLVFVMAVFVVADGMYTTDALLRAALEVLGVAVAVAACVRAALWVRRRLW